MHWAEDVISLALYELRCPSLTYVYNMTWAEFLIRLFAWQRNKREADLLNRELAWISYIAPHQDPKKMKKNIKQFWPLPYDDEINTDDKKDKRKQAMLKAMKQYQEEVKKKKDG